MLLRNRNRRPPGAARILPISWPPLSLPNLAVLHPLLSPTSAAEMDFSRGMGGKPGEKIDEGKLMEEVQHTMRQQIVQEFYQTVRDKCFKMCITAPSSSLSSSEQKCLSRCMDRYQEATNIVTKAIIGQQ